jgi:DNA-binding SARP family transcriptional activator
LPWCASEIIVRFRWLQDRIRPSIHPARGRLRGKACDVAGRLAGLLRAQGRDREAIEVLNHLLRIDMANESAHRDLMLLLMRVGRRSDALR